MHGVCKRFVSTRPSTTQIGATKDVSTPLAINLEHIAKANVIALTIVLQDNLLALLD